MVFEKDICVRYNVKQFPIKMLSFQWFFKGTLVEILVDEMLFTIQQSCYPICILLQFMRIVI